MPIFATKRENKLIILQRRRDDLRMKKMKDLSFRVGTAMLPCKVGIVVVVPLYC